MPKKKTSPTNPLEGFDYRVDCDDFLLYEFGRLIDEDRASLEDDEFRRLIDEGIHQHIEARFEIRAEMAMRLRSAQADPRLLDAIEDTERRLSGTEWILRTYTIYLFRRLEECSGKNSDAEIAVRAGLERWRTGQILREEMMRHVQAAGRAAVAPVADLLFDCLDDRNAAETALDVLASLPCAVSARVLAHVISEPMLEEDLEMKAYGFVRAMWPLPRHYILYSLKPHTHEDIPFRWFQILVESNDPETVDRILEEILVHAKNPDYREDLVALIELLRQSRDPDTEAKIMQVLNNPGTAGSVAEMLETYLRSSSRPGTPITAGTRADESALQMANRNYLAAAKLFDSGRKNEAFRKLDELLQQQPDYPFAVLLRRFGQKSLQDLK